jgi:hypothetical protein
LKNIEEAFLGIPIAGDTEGVVEIVDFKIFEMKKIGGIWRKHWLSQQ